MIFHRHNHGALYPLGNIRGARNEQKLRPGIRLAIAALLSLSYRKRTSGIIDVGGRRFYLCSGMLRPVTADTRYVHRRRGYPRRLCAPIKPAARRLKPIACLGFAAPIVGT